MEKELPKMRFETFKKEVEKLYLEERTLMLNANKEYANLENVFANFNRLAERLEMPPEKVLVTYATKHFDGIISYINGNVKQRESLQERIQDLRLYLLLLYFMDLVPEKISDLKIRPDDDVRTIERIADLYRSPDDRS